MTTASTPPDTATVSPLQAAVLADRLTDDLRQRITSGALRPGDRLPTEMSLVDTFDVSRAVVREAMARLKGDGLIVSRQGSGTFVADVPKSLNLRFWRDAMPVLAQMHDIFELRAMIEGAVAELAAQRRSDDDLARMRAHLDAMDAALLTGNDGTRFDDNFHITIAAATRNAHLGRLVEFLGHHFSETRRLAWPAAPGAASLPREAQREHRALFAAIEAGQPAQARKLALEHLRGAASRVGIELAVDLAGSK